MRQRLIILFICYAFPALSQQNNNYIFRHIDHSDGLLHNEVFSIIQDSTGFIWIGTANGLQRFDGKQFVNYQDELYKLDKQINEIENVYYDNNSGIWLTGRLALDKLDILKNKIANYSDEKLLNEKTFKFKTYNDKNNRQWQVGNISIYKYDSISKTMKLYIIDLGSSSLKKSGNIFTDTAFHQTWVASYGGLFLFDETTKKVYDYTESDKHPLLKLKITNGFSKIMIDSYHNIWVVSWNHLLYKYDYISKKIITYSLADLKRKQGSNTNNSGTLLVNCIYEDANKTLWFGTQNAGLLKYNQVVDKFDYILSEEENKQALQYNYNIFCIYQDREDNIWLGTDKGISIFNPYHQWFQTIQYKEHTKASIPKNEITDVIETKTGDIIAGTWGGGISIFDSTLTLKNNVSFNGDPDNNMVWSFIDDNTGKIWMGCQHGILHIYDLNKKTFVNIQPPELQRSTVRCMSKDAKGNIYFGLHNGKIAMWQNSKRQFIPFSDTSKNIKLAMAPVHNIFIDKNDRCWVATDNGLKEFNSNNRSYTTVYWPGSANSTDQGVRQIRGIIQYNDSTLLIGTLSGGMSLFNLNTKNFTHISNSIVTGNINAIKKDSKNDIWFTSDYTLHKLKSNEKKIIDYNIEPGVINSTFVSNNFLLLHNGKWVTATSTELLFFSPDSLTRQDNHTNKVIITGFKIFDKKVYIDSFLSVKKPLELSYLQNFFTIEFAALNFSKIHETKYEYKLSGIDKDWVNADAKNFANYTDLDPGTYTFSVKAQEGDLTSPVFSFPIKIKPPFWNTWWFKTALLLVCILILYMIVRKRFTAIRHEAQLKQKIAETEMMALRAQMNPHFIFNCINAIDNLIQTDQKDKATTYLARFAKLIRAVLDSSKNNVVPFYKDLESLNLFLQLEQFRCSNKFDFELKADEEIINGDYKVPPLIIQPFLENAIHHGLMNKIGTDKKLYVKIGLYGESIHYSIIDNGVGRDKALQIKNLNKPEHVSYGIQISTERVHLFNNDNNNNVKITDLYNDSGPSGTMVEVTINTNNINNK